MQKTSKITSEKRIRTSKNSTGGEALRLLAFDNSFQPNIISLASNGKILIANTAACVLLGYSEKELVTKSMSDIFNISDMSFQKMLKQRTAEGHSSALVTVVVKNGRSVPVEITSAIFIGEHGVELTITTIADISQSILKQKNIDTKKEKQVADNIIIAKTRQKKIDVKNEKIVRKNTSLALAKSDARFVANNEWIKYIAKTSYDVMWDWDIKSGRVYVGKSVEEVFWL